MAWYASDYGDMQAALDAGTPMQDVGAALFEIGSSSPGVDNLMSERIFSDWLFEQVKGTILWKDGGFDFDQLLSCAAIAGSGIVVNSDADDEDFLIDAWAQIFAGRYDLPGKQLSEDEIDAANAMLDPDGDGIYYTHSGSGDSEDFLAPAMFRVTYTGTTQTCAFYLVKSATGEELDFVSGLGGGGFVRLNLPNSNPAFVYVSNVIGCNSGELQFGPNP